MKWLFLALRESFHISTEREWMNRLCNIFPCLYACSKLSLFTQSDIVGELIVHAQVGSICAPRVSTISEFANNIKVRESHFIPRFTQNKRKFLAHTAMNLQPSNAGKHFWSYVIGRELTTAHDSGQVLTIQGKNG
jgi:hypothetical protein